MSERDKVSILVATFKRPEFLKNLYKSYKSQTHPHTELFIYDSSPDVCDELARFGDDRSLKYIHAAEQTGPAEARNRLLELADGDVIMHWDDDDYYAPNYVYEMIHALGENDFVCLSGWFALSLRNRQLYYWDTEVLSNFHFSIASGEEISTVSGLALSNIQFRNRFFGFTHVYRRSALDGYKFKEVWDHDWEFVQFLIDGGKRIHTFADTNGLCLHLMHNKNNSRIFPQYVLPDFLLETIFGSDVDRYQKLREHVL